MTYILTDEEISEAITNGKADCNNWCDKAVAQAQIKKIYDWGNEYCTEHIVIDIPKEIGGGTYKKQRRLRRRCPECWQSLLKGE